MSSPIAIPRVNSTESTDAMHSSAASSTSPSKYVPVHRRQPSSTSAPGSSPASSRVPSPTPSDVPSWRSHSPSRASASPQGRKFPSKAYATHRRPQHKDHASPRTHIPQPSSIPTASTLPFVYSINDLLALSSTPATPAPPQLQSLQEVVSLLALPINNDKAAVRRRRNGRRSNSSKTAQVKQDAPVEVRRTRHGHGTWGWQMQHRVESLEEPWRHPTSQAIAVVA